ncbi:MAG: lamin tail domain-containing protein, partial [Bacteroidales bacterium]|nr:lamin tail domain-containing protein [Bacteroidales bacterium]
MKRQSIFIAMCLFFIMAAQSQVVLHTSENFEDGLPAGWTFSSNNVSVEENETIAINGKKFVRVKHASGVEYLQSPQITVGAGQSVRLEFNHIPMTKCNVRVQLVVDGNPTPMSLSGSNVYDNKYRPGINGATGATFNDGTYYPGKDITKVTSINQLMWQHEVYYLTSKLGDNVTFSIRFQMPTGNDNGYGWLIDDFKIYTAPASDGILPRLEQIVTCPNMKNYPYCNDANIEFKISDADGGLTTTEDSLYVAYYTPHNPALTYVKLQKTATGNYSAQIPYMGIDSTVYWKAVITDANGNKTNYPYTGNFYEFKYVRPYTGDEPVKQNATGSESLIFATDYAKVSNQIRYSAQELWDAGYSAGIIGGFYLNIKTRPSNVPTLQNFKIYIGSISSDYKFDEDDNSQYSDLVNVVNQVEFIVPDLGWQYIPFDNNSVFVWDGQSDIIIKTCFDGTKVGGATKVQSYSSGSDKQYQTRRLLQDATTSIVACSGNFNTDSKFLISSKPNIRFNFINECYFSTDAGIRKDTLLLPNPAKDCQGNLRQTYVCQKGVAATLKVMLRNDGTTPITKVKVKWMTDDDILTLDSSLWTGTMKPLSADKIPQDTAVVFTATTKFLPSAGVHELKIWTEMADNTTIDWNYANDTAVFKLFVTDGSMSGNYAVGGTIAGIASGRTFKSFEDAFIMLINSGVGGACNFRINSNNSDTVYLDNIDFPSCIQGLSESNTITFSNEDLLHEVVFEPKANLPYIFDLSDIKYFSFKNIAFSVNPSLFELNVNQFDIIKMNDNSSHIKFDSCRFLSYQHTAKYYDRIASAVNIGKASDISINNCTFDLPARYVVKGEGLSSSSPVKNINISNSVFNIISDSKQNMVENAVNINFAKDINITKNIFTTSQEDSYYENLTSVYYSVLLSNTENAMVTKNKFELLSLSAVSFSSVNNSMVANNMFSLDNINTNAVNYNAYGLYVQSGKNNYVVYNNVYTRSMKLSSKKTYGFNLGSASESSGNIVKNNILVSEGYGYAVALRSVNNDFALSRNMYYKKPTINNIPLFSYNGATNTNIETWKTQTGETNAFYEEDPFFQSWNNLYSTNITLCESGDWVNGVEDDYFDSDRPKATEKRPCIGNREFNPPPNNIYVLATGLADYDMTSANTYAECDLSYEKIFVEFKNVSSNTIPANTVKFNYSVNGNVSVVATFPNEVKPDEVYHFEFPQTYDFSALSGNMSFDLKAFSVLDIDTVKSNDTASANIISYYRLPALADQNIDVKYGNSVQIDVTSLCPNDSVYWFYTPASTDYFHKGHSFQTDLLYSDSTIYFARREETPVIRITEIQYSKDASKVGLTPNIPNYVTANNAYEISNCGSLDVDMSGYQFVYYSGSNITKSYATYTFPNGYVLKANSAVVLVASNSVTVGDDVAISVDATKFKVATTAKGGFAVVNASGKYIDALTVNGAAFANSMNVPATVWQSTDEPVAIVAASAGIIRNDVKSTTSLGWIAADEFNTMSIGRYNEDLTDSTENLCLGHLTPYNIHITDVPNYDPGVSVVYLDTVSSLPYNANNPFYACGLSESEIKINLTNTGLKDLESIPVVCLIYDNGVQIDSFTAEYTNTLKQFESAEFTFASKLDLTANNNDRNIVIKVYTSRDDDVVHNNDTAYFYILSAHTPLPPVAADVTADYGTQALLTANSDYVVIWYDAIDSQEELARGSQYETPVLYEDKTYYVETLLQKQYAGAIGKDSALVTTSNPSPSPLNAKTKNIKEQYLLSADSLSAYGYSEGNIKGFAVKISSIT